MKLPWLFILFMAFAILSLIGGAVSYFREERFFATADHSTAKIIRYAPDRNPKVADFCPVYEFTTKDGRTISYQGDDCLSRPDANKIGEIEEVYYDPQSPQIVESRGWLGSEGSGLIMGIAGAIFFSFIGLANVFAAVLRSRSAKKRTEPKPLR
jgi:Protein of unknown function (DUF3592)